MTLLVPAALAFGIIIPIIALLYFMRPKRQERVVSSTLLWRQALQDLQASRPWQRLRMTPLLLLQLLAALVVVLVLARPATFFHSAISGDTIIILQASASMQAMDVAPSRFEEAKSEIADLISGIGPDDSVSLITMARTPQVLIAESQDKGQLDAALQRARVTNQDADLEQALSLATALAAGRANAQILVVGDGHVLAPDQVLALPIPVRYLRVGTDAGNAALIALAARNVNGNLMALAQVANYSQQQRAIPVELYADSRLVNVQTIDLAAGASGSVQWGPLPATTHFLHARLDTQDPMRVDHDAWAIAGGSMHGKVLLVTNGNSFLEAALRLQTNINLYETTPTKYVDGDNYDLTIFDGFVPPVLPAGSLFFVNPPAGSYIFGKSGQDVSVGQINTGEDSANLLQDVDLSSIHALRSSHQLIPAAWAQAVITTSETPLLIAGETDNRRVAALGFNLHESDFPLQPSFPILIFNMVNWFLPPPVAGDGQISPGTPVTIAAWPGTSSVTITSPGAKTVAVAPPFPATAFAQTDATGIYVVAQRVQGQERDGAFVVNLFDPSQSRLAPTNALPVVHSTDFTTGGAAVPRVLREIWPWIAAFFLLVLCAEWWLFSRGYARKGAAAGTGQGRRYMQGGNGRLQMPERAGMFGRAQDAIEVRYRDTRRRFVKTIKRMRRDGIHLR